MITLTESSSNQMPKDLDPNNNICVVLKNEITGDKRWFFGSNIVTNDGDIYYAKKSEELTTSQMSNRDFLKEQLSDIHHGFYYSINDSLEDAMQLFVKSKDVQLIMMMGKNLNYFDQLLFYPVSKAPKYFKKIPFFVLHE